MIVGNEVGTVVAGGVEVGVDETVGSSEGERVREAFGEIGWVAA